MKPDQRTDITQSLIDTIATVQHCTRNDAGTYFVTASNNSGKKSAECEVTIYGPPGPPQDLSIDGMTANTCSLSWRHPKDDGGSPVTCYLVQRKEMPDGKWVLVKGDVPVCSFIVPRLIEGKSYAFRVIAENKFGTGPGTETRPKMIKSLIKLPGPPENPLITDVSRNMMIVCWEPPLEDGGSPITGYWLEKRDSNNQRWFKVSKAPIVGTRERVTGLYANVEYDFRTSAINAAGVGPPSKPTKPRTAKDQAIPPGPPRPVVVDTTRSSVTLEWEPPARDGGSPIIGYYVELKKFRGEADWERCHDTELVHLRELVVPDLNEGEEYWFRVFAVNEVGEGPPGDVPGRVIVKERIEEVEMDLDADIKEGVTVRAGNPVRLMAYFKGKPEPKCAWKRVGTETMMRGYPENTSISTALIIKTTSRSDTGKYALTVENKAGAKTMQTSVTVLDVPGPVLKLHPSHVTKRTVTLKWEPPEDDGGSRVTKYRIEKRDVSRKAWQRVSDTRDVTITIMDLVEEAEYIFQVCAENKYGVGAPSETAPVMMAEPLDPPGPPENLTVTDVTKRSVGITWEPPKHDGGSKVTHYTVEMKAPGSSTFERVESKLTQLFYNFLELSEGEAYTFRACAVNAVGAGPYAQTPPVETREKLIPPGIKLQEEMTVRAGDTINITAGITGKPVPALSWERGGKPLMAVDRVSLVNDATSSNLDIRKCMRKIDQGVYQVTATNKAGTASKQVKVTILDVPGEPNDVKISRVFSNEMTVTWSKPYQDGGSPITNYVVDRRDVHMVTWTQVSASIDPKKMVIVAHKLLEGVEYVFRVRAENSIGVGPPAESKPTLARSPYGPPGPPESPEITKSGRNWLNIVWQKPKDDGGAPVSGYWLERKEPTGARWMQINRLAIEDLHHKVTGLVEGTQYEFRVAAENRAGVGPPSFPSVPRAPATPIRLPGPPTPKVVDVTRRSVSLRWTPPEDDGGSRIIGYVVERRRFDSDIWKPCHDTERIVGQELTMGDLPENTKYVFRVSAVNLAGQGENAETPGITQVRDPTEMPDYELDASVKELMIVKVGTPLRIPVFIKGKPRPSMEWAFNGQPLVSDRMKTENTEISHTLVISPCEKKDAGRYTLHLENPLGDVSVNIRVKVVGPPGPPTTPFKVGRVLENAVPLSWGMPDDNGGSEISNYIVEKRIVGQKGWYKVSSNVARQNIVVSRLEKDYQYLFRVAAENQYGIGPFIETDGPVTASDPIVPPDMPEHLDITRVTRKTVELVWKRPKYDGGSPITGYIVESRNLKDDIDDWNLCNDYVLKDLGFIVTGLIENDKYEFKVAAQNKVGTGKYNNTRAVQVKDEIEQPDVNIDLRLGDTLTVKEGSTIDIGARIKGKPDLEITWAADENALTDSGRVIMSCDPPKARLEVLNARRSDRGKYSITVQNKHGKKSSSIKVNVLAKPGPPRKLQIDEITNSYAILNWEPPEDDGGSPVLNYVVLKKETARNVWAPVAEAYPVAKQTIHIPNLLEGSEYVFRVQAENQIGIGRPNDTMPIVARWRYRVPDAPDAPSISDIRRNAMTATWREPFNGGSKVTGYYLEKKEKDASRWLPVNQEPIPDKTHRITGLLEGMDYVFRVKAENRAGVGPPGPPSRPQKAEDPIDPPGPVIDPECYEVTRSSASLRWKKPETDGGSRILGYIIEKRKADSDLWTSCHDTEMHRSLELVVPSLLTGQKYVFRACAVNRAGRGPWEPVPGTILIKEREEPLVLNLDASFKELYVLRAGTVLRIPVMIGGRPEPKIEWFKEGQKTHGRTLIENTAISTTLLIKNCYKSDAGEYMCRISNPSGKKECRVQVRVVDKPSVPLNLRSKPEEITSDMVPLYWDPPEDDGGAKITHYIVEKREAKRAAWASVCNTVRTTCIAPELVEKMVYEFRVRAVNEIGEGENALSGKIRCQPPLSPPGPPLMLDVEDTSKDSILLDWDPPREDGGSKILGYFVEMKGPEDTEWRQVNKESFTSSRWEVKSLRDDVDYDFQVKATNAIGVGPPSEPITGARCFELPSAPAIDLAISMRDLVVVKAGTPIKLHARIEGYPYPSAQWLFKGEPLEAGDRYSMKTTKFTADMVLKPSMRSDTGRYHLVVKNLAGTRKAPINVKVLDRPGPPQAPVQFEDIHQDQVTLRWNVPADDGGTEVTNYIVERREAAKTFWTTVNSNLSRTRIMVPKLIEGTPYVFRIKAENKMGISDPLDSEPVTPKSPYDLPGPPLELRIINVQSDSMSLTWLEPDFDGGSPVQGYFLEKRDKISKRWLKIEKEMLTTTSYKVEGLIEGFSYEFRVSAKNVVGTGPPSEPTFPSVARPPLDPPDPPLEPHVVDQTRSTVDLEWDEPVYDGSLPIEGYLVEHHLKGVESWTKSHDTSMVANMYYTVAGLEEGREYQFRVFAINGAGKSKPAEVPGFTVVRDITIYPEIELDASCKDTVYARANQIVRLPVYIKGRPDPKIMWSKEGKDLAPHITIEKLAIGELLKLKVSRPDSGRYTVSISNVCGEVSKNINLVVLDRPGPPRNITVKYVKKDSCVLNWDIPEDDGGSQITNYIVERRLPNENLWRNVTSNIRSRVSKVMGLNEGYSYFFRVKAENKYGIGLPVETTEPTLAADPIDRPTEPRDLEVTAVTNNSVSLKWLQPTYDGGSPLTTYIVERCRLGEPDHTRINTDDLLEKEFTATGLNPGAKYEFRVKARNIRYIGPPSTPTPFIEARDDTKPPKIELDLRLLDVLVVRAGTKVHLEGRISGVPMPAVKWSRGGKEIATSDHYEVTTLGKDTCLTLRSARRRDTGNYEVKVENSAGAMNATAKVIVQDVPGPPVGPLKIRDMTSESMTIEWKMPHDDGGAEVTSYLVEKMDTKIGHWFPVDTSVTKFSLKVTQLTEGHEYQFRIRGRNKIGLGEPFVSKPRIAKRPYDLPGPPSAPIVHTVFPDNATLIWQPPESDGGNEISRYILEKKDINSIKWVRAVETISNDTRYNVPNLVEGMEYQFRAAAENAAGLGKFGPPSTPIIAREPIDLPDPPVNPKCVDTTRSSATIAWKKPILDGGSDIVGYLVEYRAADSENWEIGTPKIHTLQFVVTDLTEGAEYYFRVSAINEAGVGPPGDCPGKVLIKDILASPDFELDASMKKTLTVRAGQPIRMYVSISGRPEPEIRWEKEGQPLDYRAEVENTEYSSQLAIYNTNRYDAGRYDLILMNAVGEKTASVNVKVFDTPGPPGPINIKEVSKDHMVITWTPPTVDGGSAVSNYIVEKRDESRRTWSTVTTNNPKLSCRIPNLVETVTYFFQVFAENKYGIGEPVESMPAKAQDAVGPPGPVVKLHVADITRITAHLEWTKPTFDGGSKVTGYVVETQEAGSVEWEKAGLATECHYQVLGLTPGHGFRFRVKAQNAAGQGDPADTEMYKAQDEKIAPKINLDVTMRETVVVKAGHTLTIYAGISGKPVPHTRWAKDGAMMKPDRRLLFKKSHTETRFSLKEVTRADGGTYALRAYNDAGEKTANVFVKVLDKPGPPASLQIDEVTANSVSISWRPPTHNGGVEVNNYLVERCDVQRGVWLTVNANVTRFMFKFPDLIKGREYAFRVMAENRIGVGEPAATEKVVARDAIEPPGPPSAPEITEICKDAIGFAWEPPKYDGGSAITGYIIERREKQSRRWIKLNREAVKKREYRSEGLLEGFEYDFRVRAVNQAGTGDPSEPSVPVRAEEQISPPRNLRVIDYSRSFVTIAWEPPEFDAGSKILGYFIWRRNIEFKGWAPCNEKIWTDRRFHIKALTENKKYLFMVKAKNAAGMISLPATIGPVETKDEFEPPKILLSETFKDVITVKAGETVSVNINFTGRPRPRATWEKDDSTLTLRDRIRVETTPENSLLTLEKTERADTGKYTLSVRNEAGQRNAIVRLIVQDKPSPPQAPVETSKVSGETCMVKWKPPKDDGGSPIHSYIIEKRDTTRQVWTRAATVDAGKLSAQVTKLTRGQQYVMRVSAQNAIGTSDPQIGEPFLARDFFDVPGPPGQPEIIKVCKKYVHLTWTPPINDGGSKVTGYLIERSDLCPSITTFWIRCTDEVIKDTEHVLYNLFEGCDYEFRVTACNAAGWGIPSEGSEEVKVRDPVAPPVAPGKPELLELTKSSIKLNWARPYYDGGSPIIGYILESRKEGQEEWTRVHRPEYIIPREWTLKDLTEGTKYDFRVFALNDAGQSEASENSGIIEVKEIIIPADVEPDASLWRTQIVRASTGLRLFVPIKGKPTPEITWTKGEENLEERANITNTDTASLFVLPNMQRLDAGKYCITAENKAGKKSSFINVKVLGPPGPPGPIKVKDISKDSCIIQWSAPDDDGGSDVFNYIVEKKEAGRVGWATVTFKQQKNTYRITNLVETCTYYFRVIGENKYGIGEPVETEEPICALDPVEPPEKPKNLTVEEVTPATVSLAWKRPDWDGGSRISGYLVEYLAPGEEEWTKAATARNVSYTVFGLDRDATYRFRVTTLTELSQSVPAELPEPITCKEEQLAPTLDLSSIKGDTLIVKGGTDLTLTIPVRGAPDPTVAWMHGLQQIQEKGRYFTKKTREFTRLQIKKTKKEDGGKFTITATNVVGSTSAVFNLKVLDKPGPPYGPITFDDVTDESVMLGWEPPKDDGGSEVTHYVVEKSDVRTAQWQYVSSEVRRTHLKVTGLNKGAQYQFRVSAENRFGVGTPLNSSSCYVRAPFDVPDVPQNLKVVGVTKSQITIAYEAPENDGGAAVTGYMVERKEKNSPRWIKATKMPISDNEFTSMGLMEGLQYMHRVRAVNQAGTGPACDPTPLVIAMDPIAPPRNLEILEVSSKFVHVQWKKPIYDGGARITGYVIEARDVRSEKWVKCHLGEVLKLEHVITDIKALQKYQFRVKAKNEAGNISEPSNLAGPVLTKDDLQPPTITLDVKIKDNKVQVHAGDKLVISGHLGGKPVPTIILTKGRLVLRSQGRVSIDQKGKAFALCVSDASRADAGEYTITAENNSGSVTSTVKVLVMGKPGPPMGLQVLETTPDNCTVSWQPPEDDGGAGVTNYVIEKMDLKTKNWKKVSGAVRKTTFKIPKLIPFNEYQFRVSAQNMFGVGDPATTGNVLARHPFDTPGPPAHVQVREITRESLKLLWSPPENDGGSEIIGFFIERKEKTSVRWERLNKEPVVETRFRVLDLEEGLEYECRISAVNAAGVGKPSAPTLPITAQDPVDKPGPPGPPEVEDTTRHSISLTWTKPTSDGRSKIIGYVLEMQPVGTEEWTKVHTTSTIKLLSYVVDELTENKEYVFRVSAVNAVGVSEPSASTAPTAARERQEPPDVEVDASMKRSLTVRAGNPIRFYVGIKGRPAPACTWVKEDVNLKTRANIETTEYSTTMTIATANRDDAGKYELTVENPHGKKTVGTYVKVYDTPGPPEEVVVKGATSKTAVIDWDPPSKDGGKPVVGYILEKKEVSRRTWDTIDSDIVKTCYRVTDLVEGNQYFFRVLAVNDFGIGDPGETEAPTLAIDPADQPEPPRNFHVTEITPNSVSLAWKKPDYDGGAPITSYVVEMLPVVDDEEEGEWRKCTQINALRYTVADLLKGEKYRFRVSAQNYGAVSKPAELLQPVVAKEQIFPPAMDLQGITSDTIMVKEGTDFVLKIPYSGQPVPTVTWKRGLGVMQQTARIFTKTTRELTQLFIKRAMKADSGQFSVSLSNAAGSQQADFQINVLGKPGPPEGPVDFEDVSAESVTMNWKAPNDDGGSEVTNYVIEKSDNRGVAWVYVSSGVKRTTMRVTKLTKGKVYAFRISAENRFGVGRPIESPYITAKDPYDIPGPPGIPETHDVTREQMCLTWPEPADNGGSPVTGYVIERKEMFSNRWVKLNRAPVRKNEFTSTQLTEGKEYEFRVCAVNAAGVGPPSEPSRPRKAVDPVGIPRNVEILEITRSSVTLSWARPTHDGGSKLTSYIIERRLAKEEKWTQHITSDLGNLTYAVKGLKQGEKYVFRVKAKNAAGTVSDPSHAVGPIICKDDLAPPKILLDTRLKEKVTVAAGSAITLAAMVSGKPQPEISWSKGTRTLVGTNRMKIDSTARSTQLAIKDCCRSDSGKYTLTAINGSGSAVISIQVTVLDRPGPPSGPIQVGEVTPETAVISWAPPSDDGGAEITNYVVQRSDVKQPDVWIKVSAAVRKTTHKITKLNLGTTYCFRVRAQNMNGIGDALASEHVEARYPFDTPSAPGQPQVKDLTAENCRITWTQPETDGGSEITGYIVEKKEKNSIRWERINRDLVQEMEYMVLDLEEGLEYSFRVCALNKAGRGKASPQTKPTVAQDPLGKPGSPVNAEVVDTTRTSADLKWEPPIKDGGEKKRQKLVLVC
ncbi:titin-like [Branchiostoma lanceolatum]|uniref:titin-like n=1 Tax=Branchiostoma lanceolatum TaxID=7740 RepID=UPI0034553FEA